MENKIIIISLLLLILLSGVVLGYGETVLNYPENNTLIGNNFVTGVNFNSQTDPNFVNGSYDHELVINGTRYGVTNCLKDTACVNAPNGTIPNGVNLTGYINATNGSNVNQSLIIYFSYDTINPFHNISGNYRGNASYFNAGSILAQYYINDTMIANYTLYLYNASNGGLLHSYNRTLTSNTNFTFNYSVQSWIDSLNFSTTFYAGGVMDQDNYIYSLSSVDWFNNKNVTNVTIVLDRTLPTSFTYNATTLANATNNSGTSVVVGATFTEINPQNATVYLINATSRIVRHSANVTLTGANVGVNFTSIPDGYWMYSVNVTDKANNQNFTDVYRWVMLDATVPLVSYASQTVANGSNFSVTTAYANVSLTETNFANFTFELYNMSSGLALNTTYYNVSSQVDVNFTNLSDGWYYINVTATDTVNHKNTSNLRGFLIDLGTPVFTIGFAATSILNTETQTINCSFTDNHDPDISRGLSIKVPSANDYATISTGVYTSVSTAGTYSVRCSGSDDAGNAGETIRTFTVTASTSNEGSSSSSSGSSSRAPATTKTETIETSEEEVITELEEAISLDSNIEWTEVGFVKLDEIVGGEVYNFVTTADQETHTMTIESVDETTGTVVVIIQSEPQTLTLTLEAPIIEVDLNGDGTNDLRVTLIGITDGKATINVEKIDGLFEEPVIEKNNRIIWISIFVVLLFAGVILVVSGIISIKRRSRKKSNHHKH